MQVAGSIDNCYIVVVLDSVLYSFVGYSSRICIYVFVEEVVVYLFGLDFELVYGSSLESIICIEDYFFVFCLVLVCQFVDCGGFIYVVYVYNKDYIWFVVGRQGVVFDIYSIVFGQQLYDFVLEDFVEF